MARGITENDVWQAADALLLEGARPTIERVRQKIGRGSPNTVSPFLETWFRHLGGRIKDPGAFAAPSDVPEPVLQAARHFWEAALAETRRDFDERLRDGMAAAVANVEAEKERAATAEAAAFEATSRATHLHAELVQLTASMEQELLARARAEAQRDEARALVDDFRARHDGARRELAIARDRAQQEIAAAIERLTAVERRAALDVDAERTHRARAEKRADQLERRLEDAQRRAQVADRAQQDAIGVLQRELAQAQADAADATSESVGLREQLAKVRTTLIGHERELQVARAEAALAERVLSAAQPPGAKKRRVRRNVVNG